LVIHADLAQSLFGGERVDRGDRRNRLAGVESAIDGDDRLIFPVLSA